MWNLCPKNPALNEWCPNLTVTDGCLNYQCFFCILLNSTHLYTLWVDPPSHLHTHTSTSGPMCRLEQACRCNGRYHTGPQMGPCTVEPVAGATAWVLARWATLREAQPKQADLITLGQDWSLLPKTHTDTYIIRGMEAIMPDCVCVCFHLCGLSYKIRFHVCFPCLENKKLIRNMLLGQQCVSCGLNLHCVWLVVILQFIKTIF